MMKKGLFITVEGTDGSGKTTQFRLIRDYIREKGFDIVAVRDPGGTEIGEKIRGIILDPENTEMERRTELLLYTASRAQLVAQLIRPALEEGKVVVCDRFVDSNVAYQGYGRGLSPEFIFELNKAVTDSLCPDLTFFFDIDPKIAITRLQNSADRLENESIDFHKRVYDGYCKIASDFPGRVKRIDCTRSIEEVFEDVKVYLDEIIG